MLSVVTKSQKRTRTKRTTATRADKKATAQEMMTMLTGTAGEEAVGVGEAEVAAAAAVEEVVVVEAEAEVAVAAAVVEVVVAVEVAAVPALNRQDPVQARLVLDPA